MRHCRRIRPARLRDRRADRLPSPSARRGAAALDRRSRARHAALPRREGQRCAARRGNVVVRRRDPSGGRRRRRADQDEPHSRSQPCRPLRAGPSGRDQSRDLGGGRGRRLLLRPRSVFAARLHDRRQHRNEFGRRPLPQIRRHHQQPARRPARHLRRRDPRYRRRGDGRGRLRPARSCVRLRRPARDRD